jgi:hypothetical protein
MRQFEKFRPLLAALCILCVWNLNGCDLPVQKKDGQTDTISTAKPHLIAKPVIIEIITHDSASFDPHALYDMGKSVLGDITDIRRWKNHISIYLNIPNPEEILMEVKKEYPQDSVKYYDKPFYTFNRKNCADTINSEKWDNIVMTASLVNDPKLQQEYLNYHAMQFKNWPQVARGFCNADFQQVLVFKNGRQLMLVISIPKGESLDKLNPKTTANNPRVIEWNRLMAKYQQGISGTKPGEVWVVLKPIHN